MTVHAALVVVKKEGKVLFVRNRRYNTLGLPGGKLDSFEKADAAAARELKEETGLDVLCQRLVPITIPVMSGALNGHVVQTFFATLVLGEAKQVEEGTVMDYLVYDYAIAASKWDWWFRQHLPSGMIAALPNTIFEQDVLR